VFITQHKSRIKTVRQGDPLWNLKDTLTMAPRAGFEISKDCPKQYQEILMTCLKYGWIKPVANMYSTEYLRDALGEDL